MPVVKRPSTKLRSAQRRRPPRAVVRPLQSVKNPHINVHAPISVRCFAKSNQGEVTFENHGREEVMVIFFNHAVFEGGGVSVKPGDSITLPVQVERGTTKYITGPARHVYALQVCSVSTKATQSLTYSGPKDIIVP